MRDGPPDVIYIFFRAEGWYLVELWGDEDILPNVELNPGTLRVEDMAGRIVWRQQ